jgi:hypothetical protein
VIVVDDGSTDDSRQVIARFGDRVVSVLKDNGGQASSLNVGFRAARGEAIIFLDSDDLLLPTAAEKAVACLRDPGVAKVHWPLWTIDAEGKKDGNTYPGVELADGDLREPALAGAPAHYIWPPTSGNAWSRRFLESALPIPEEQFRTSPDFYLAALAPFYGLIRRVDEPQGCWRLHGTNNSGEGSTEQRISRAYQRAEFTLAKAREHCEALGLSADIDVWRRHSHEHRMYGAMQDVIAAVPENARFILADAAQWGEDIELRGRRALPIVERDGQYAGPPADDRQAIEEIQRLRAAGASALVIAWPCFWWLEYYAEWARFLHERFRVAMRNERMVVFDLKAAR